MEAAMKLAIALDLPTATANTELVTKLTSLPTELCKQIALKIGLRMFVNGGPAFVKGLVGLAGIETVLDLKLPDIPNTNSGAAKEIAALGVDMFTVKADVGRENMREIKKALTGPNYPTPPKMLAVTALTSMSAATCQRIFKTTPLELVRLLVEEAFHGGADGIVCSPQELPYIDEWLVKICERSGQPPKMIKFIPGIELGQRNDDQQRKGGLREVIDGKADYIVVGRPIYTSDDPIATVTRLLTKMGNLDRLRNDFEAELLWAV
jgi:orotidine-5'-phosphate decarboxylase